MKKTVSFLLTLLLGLALAGCGQGQMQNSSGAEENDRVQAVDGTGDHEDQTAGSGSEETASEKAETVLAGKVCKKSTVKKGLTANDASNKKISSWLTKNGVSVKEELLEAFGAGNVAVTFSLE